MKKNLFLFLFPFIFNHLWSSEFDWQMMLDEPVVISLGRCMHRYEETYRLMEEAGFTNIQRFEAIDGINTSDEFFRSLNIFSGSKGEKGCAASHLLLWKQFLEDSSEKEYLFVCEDDMLPHSDFFSLFPIYWEATPKDFDILMVGNNLPNHKNSIDLIIIIPTHTTHAYIISKKGAQKLLDLHIKNTKDGIIDVFLQNLMGKNEIIYYCYNGKLFPDKKNIKSIIGTGICFQNKNIPSTIRIK